MKFVINGTIVEVPVAHYTFSSGLTNTDGTISVTKPIRGVFTQEEFDALPEEEKNSGMCVVDDGAEDSGGSSSSTMYIDGQEINLGGGVGEEKVSEMIQESLIEYSTDPVQIGTWIPGFKVYRKCFYKVLTVKSSETNTTIYQDTLPVNAMLLDVRGIVVAATIDGLCLYIGQKASNRTNTTIGSIPVEYNRSTGRLIVKGYYFSNIFNDGESLNVNIIIEYASRT